MIRQLFPTLILFSAISLSLAGCSGADGLPASRADTALEPLKEDFLLFGTVLEDEDVSTLSRGDGSTGILASDEGATIQLLAFSSDSTSATIAGNVPLTQPGDLEIDFEASAFLDGWFYITGSHGNSKKKGEYEEPRARIFRFQVNEDGKGVNTVESSSLAPIFAADSTLSPHHKMPLQEKGLNIEGLAARDGYLFIGLRAPNLEGNALVVKVAPGAIFSDETPDAELLRVPLEKGLGIRSMHAAGDGGFLLIAGNAGAEPSEDYPVTSDYIEDRPSALYYWNPDSGASTRLGLLPKRGKGKEEALLVLPSDSSESVKALILYDSIPGGGATIFSVQIPSP